MRGGLLCGVLALESLLASGCSFGLGAGPALPLSGEPRKAGGNGLAEAGLVFDYGRVVRVGYSRSLQLYHGARFTSQGQRMAASLPNSVQIEVTILRLPDEMYLRTMTRVYWGSEVRLGPVGADVRQRDAKSHGALFGATLLFAGDHQGVGPLGLSLSAGVLVARADAASIEPVTYLVPMALVGFDLVPPWFLYCWFIDDECPHHLQALKN